MTFSLLSNADCVELNATWQQRSKALFEKAVVSRFVSDMVDRAIERDLKTELLEAMKMARKPNEIWVSAGLCYDDNHRFTEEGFGNRWLSIKQLIYRTDALAELAKQLGPQIKVSPLYENNVIFLKIQFVPSA